MLRNLGLIFFCCMLTVVGLVGGWFAGRSGATGANAESEPEGVAAADQQLDERTLANLGVRIAPAERTTFTRFRSVQAVVEDRPQNVQPVVAPLGGIVTKVEVETGGAAKGGDTLIILARDPIPRPKPELTADILTPISEEVHAGVSALRMALGELKIADGNLARVRRIAGDRPNGGVSILRKSEIEYENQRARVLVALTGARSELERHGLTAEEIASIEAGGRAPRHPHLWEHALRRQGLWLKEADAIRAALPEAQRALPWCVAAIGELSAAGLASNELVGALSTDERFRTHFAEVSSLLLTGMPLATVRLLSQVGALEEKMVLRAPPGVEQWDVQAMLVRPGQRVEAGQVLLQLHDARRMWLRVEPVGAEIGHVVRALSEGSMLLAVPLIGDSGPVLTDLHLTRLVTNAQSSERGGLAYADVVNTRLCPVDCGPACSWSLRVGLRYVLRVPIEDLPGRFVLPVGAVTSKGPERIVLIRDGAGFRPQPVRIDYEDDEVTVIRDDGGIFEDDPVVMSGAFALSLALELESGPVDPHAGHSH